MDRFGLSQLTLQRIHSVLAKHTSITQVVLYGSRAKGNYRNGSDIDLTIMDEHISFSDLLKIENELDDLLLPYKIDLSLYEKIDSVDVKEHIQRVGCVFYERVATDG